MQQTPDTPADRAFTASIPRLAYTVRGPETGTPVVLLHGVGSSASTWIELQSHLGSDLYLVALDYRGHGASDPVTGTCDLSMFVDDHVRLLDELGIRSAHVVGFSVGAIFAQAIAVAHPDRTRSVVLLSSIAGRSPEERDRALSRLEVIRRTPPAESAAGSIRRWFTADFIDRRPDLVEAERSIVAGVDHPSYAATYEVLATTDLVDQAQHVAVPTLVVTGEHDEGSTPAMSRQLHERIAGATLVVVPGVKHYLHIERAAELAVLVTDFLHRVDP